MFFELLTLMRDSLSQIHNDFHIDHKNLSEKLIKHFKKKL